MLILWTKNKEANWIAQSSDSTPYSVLTTDLQCRTSPALWKEQVRVGLASLLEII